MADQIYRIADYKRFEAEITCRYTVTWREKLADFTEDSRFTLEIHDEEYMTVHLLGTQNKQYIARYFERDYFEPVETPDFPSSERLEMLAKIARNVNPRFGYFFRHFTGAVTLIDNSGQHKDIGYFENWQRLTEYLIIEFEKWSQKIHEDLTSFAQVNEVIDTAE